MNELDIRRIARISAMEAPYSDPRFPPSPYYRFLRNIAIELGRQCGNMVDNGYRARLSVELGVCGGGGSLHMALGSEKAVGIDIANDYPENLAHIQEHHKNFEFIIGDSITLAPMVYSRFGKIDLLFIDTTHTYEQTMAEYNAYKDHLSDIAVVCLDDLERPGMDKAWAAMPGNKIRLDFLHPSQSPTDGGFGVIWK